MFMKRFLLTIFFLLTSVFLYSQSYNYKPFFTVRVIDNEGTEFLFSDMSYFDSNEEIKYFFWMRRGSESGTATYQIDFKKIKSMLFDGQYDKVIPNYTSAEMTLTSGEVFDVLINTSGKIGGMDNDFGIYGEIYMNYNIIESIEFLHDGQYKFCPFCTAVFYSEEYEICPFDKTPLLEQQRQ